MKRKMKALFLGCAASMAAFAAFDAQADAIRAGVVDWTFPRTASCHEGLAFSDGVTGVLVWGGGEDRLVNLTVGRADLWDHRGGYPWLACQSYTNVAALAARHDEKALGALFPNPAKPGEPCNPYMLPLGRVTLKYPAGWTLRTGTLDTATGLGELAFERQDAEARVAIAMPKAKRCFAMALPKGFSFEVAFVPATDREPFFSRDLKPHGFEKAVARADGFDWRLPADKPVSLDCVQKDGLLVLTTSRDGSHAAREIVATTSFPVLRGDSIRQWSAFWHEGARVRVPDPVVQRLYDYGMYRFGAMTDPDGVPAGLQGAWLEDDQLVPWNGDYHFNINVQECYSPAYRGGHFKHLLPLFKMVLAWRPRLRENARQFVQIEDGYVLPHSVDDRGVCIGGFWTGTIDHGSTAWTASMMFRYAKYARDAQFLRDGAYDFMKGAMNVYLAMAEEKKDGTLSFPLGASPEWYWVGRDSSFQLAAAHRLARDLSAAAAWLGEKPDPRWADLDKRLPLFCRGKDGGIDVYENQPLTESHRHHSHLAGFYPFDVLDVGAMAKDGSLKTAYDHWVAMGTGYWTGWCVPWASILNVHFGQPVAAVAMLHAWDTFFCNPGHGSLHNAYHEGFTMISMRCSWNPNKQVMQMDGQCAAATAVLELMAHEVDGKVEFFRGCPESWTEVAFENLALSDGRRVSGRRVNGRAEIRGE